jgi:hypothetical protein
LAFFLHLINTTTRTPNFQEEAMNENRIIITDETESKSTIDKPEIIGGNQALSELSEERSIHDDLACAVLPEKKSCGAESNAKTTTSSTGSTDGGNSSGNIPSEPSGNSFSRWFKQNNPLYLLSVLLMLLGLHLVSSDAKASNVGVHGLLAFFAVQNLYELIMVGMALYLLKFQVQPGHGKLLLVFVLLFLGDVTFYQVRISGLSVWYGNLATMIYLVLAVVKFAAVIRILKLTIYHWRIFYVFSSFALIWVGPKVAYNIVDSVGKASTSYFDATTSLYFIWLAAGLIHLPIILQNWFENRLEKPVSHKLVGNETTFWRYLMIFPFIMMPLQLFFNVMVDSSLTIAKSTPAITLVIPWIVMAGFFIQALWKISLQKVVKTNHYDSALLITSLVIVFATTDAELIPVIINYVLVITGLVVTFITRANLVNGMAISMVAMYFAGRQVLAGVNRVVEYGSSLSKTAWAAILMFGSFIMLGFGFMISIMKNGNLDHHKSE